MMTAESPADTRIMGIVHAAFRRGLVQVRVVLTTAPVPLGIRRQGRLR
jgi:hypothetical protein